MSIKLVDEEGNARYYNKAGHFHRLDGPAIELANGTKSWYKDGWLHREDGLPAIELANGTKSWYKNGYRHREDGPAIVWGNGYEEWFLNGVRVTEMEVMGKEMTLAEISEALGYNVRLKEE